MNIKQRTSCEGCEALQISDSHVRCKLGYLNREESSNVVPLEPCPCPTGAESLHICEFMGYHKW